MYVELSHIEPLSPQQVVINEADARDRPNQHPYAPRKFRNPWAELMRFHGVIATASTAAKAQPRRISINDGQMDMASVAKLMALAEMLTPMVAMRKMSAPKKVPARLFQSETSLAGPRRPRRRARARRLRRRTHRRTGWCR